MSMLWGELCPSASLARPRRLRRALVLLVVPVAALLWLAVPAAAAPSGDPVRIWSVSRIEQGAGAVPVREGAQVGGKLQEHGRRRSRGVQPAPARPVLVLPAARPSLREPVLEPRRSAVFGAGAGAAAEPDAGRGAQGRGSRTWTSTRPSRSRRTTPRCGSRSPTCCCRRSTTTTGPSVRGSARTRVPATRCAPSCASMPARTPRRRGVTSSSAGGVAYLEGHQHSWRPGAATAADSPGPLWGEDDFDVDGDADDSGTGAAGVMALNKSRQREGPAGLHPPGRALRGARQPRGSGGRRSRRRVGRAGLHPGPTARRARIAAHRARPEAPRQAALQGADGSGRRRPRAARRDGREALVPSSSATRATP